MKKKGFISTSLIYTFFVLFLLLMLFLLNTYTRNRFLLEKYKDEIKEYFDYLSLDGVNIIFMVKNEESQDYEYRSSVGLIGYQYNEELSYCVYNSPIDFIDGEVIVPLDKKDRCFAYFRKLKGDITVKMYTKESIESDPVLVTEIPDTNYSLSESSCTKGTIDFNSVTRKLSVTSSEPTECTVVFIYNGG